MYVKIHVACYSLVSFLFETNFSFLGEEKVWRAASPLLLKDKYVVI